MNGSGLDRLVAAVAVDDDAVQVVAGRHLRGPLVADEGGEAARLVVLLRRRDDLLPGRAVALGARQELQRRRERAAREAVDDLQRRLDALLAARLHHVVPAPAGRVGEHLGLAGEERREEAHVVGVVGDDEEIERPRELHPLAARRRQLLAAREAVGVLEAEPVAEGAGVHRGAGVEMRVAPEDAAREVAPGIGRIARRLAGRDGRRRRACRCR